ncbi:MAG: response regulator transcription factor [Sphingomonas sp.]|uniref:response regulator transcription factor n=1 Tax=Sphingomonas sp. TaxID=28214 RepID=UPI001AFCDD3F|nr:response regulator transcription factor [Sphingomonas sp.]MBO9622321.1 response regulator transcription factor [Sphingomonas sp.]
MRLAVLEDDPAFRAEIEAMMASVGHICHSFKTSRALTTSLRQESYDLLLLDWNLPDFSGLQLLSWARENIDPCPPIIMVTGRMESTDLVAALQAGADDYVTKPVEPAVLIARVAALLRRTYPMSAPVSGKEELWGATFDHMSLIVAIDDQEVTLTAKEFGLALALFRNMHRAMSRTHLLEAVWGRNPDLPTRTLDVHVSRIRGRLGLRPERGYRLAPVHSFGYRLETVDSRAVAEVA